MVRDNAPASVRVFGPFALMDADGREIEISNKRARALLAMLCLSPGEALERESVCCLLWPGRFRAQARASLRQCLLQLGKLLAPLEEPVLDVSRHRIALTPSAVRTELSALEAALEESRFADAADILREIGTRPICEHMDLGEPLERWLDAKRRHLEGRLALSLDRALDALQRSGDVDGYGQLSEAWRVRTAGRLEQGASDKARVAVLPFQSLDGSSETGTYALWIVDELITALGEFPELLVAGRTSSFQFKDSPLPIEEIARTLRVTHIVEGSVIKVGGVFRVNIRLIDGATGFESKVFQHDGIVEDIFTLRTDIARGVARELGITLEGAANGPQRRRLTAAKEAYELYLQGRSLTMRAFGDGVLDKAIELLTQSLELDPDSAPCWTSLAEAHVYKAVYTPCLDRTAQSERMAECARKAIGLDPGQGHAHAMLGIYEWTRHNAVGALDLAHEAYRLSPNNADVAIRLGSFLLYIGRTRDALPYIEAAIEQDPVHGRNFAMLCVAQLNLGNFDAAIAAGQRMADLGMPGMWQAIAMAVAGQHDLAIERYYRSRLLMNKAIFPPPGVAPMTEEAMDVYWMTAAKGCCSGNAADREAYCRLLDGLHAAMPDPYDPSIAFPAIWMGHAELVMKIYAERIHPANMFGLMSLWSEAEPICRTRTHPDFLRFAERIGLVEAWRKYGWPDLMPAPGHGKGVVNTEDAHS